MIKDVPKSDEFKSNGIAFLNLAWESILSLALGVASMKEHFAEFEGLTKKQLANEKAKYEKKYWLNAREELAVSLALIQQGTEFLLKWKISLVSPFLLISPDSSTWKATGGDKSFSEFKTVDAQDLIKMHDTICAPALDVDFKQQFEHFRKLRNTVLHSVDKKKQFSAKDGILAILQTSNSLLGNQSWSTIRREYYKRKDALNKKYYYHYVDSTLSRETWQVFEMLDPSEIKKFYAFEPKQRKYFCPSCASDCSDIEFEYKLAQLQPNTSASTGLFCVVCGQTHEISRENCEDEDCPGNVFSEEWGYCLTCNR